MDKLELEKYLLELQEIGSCLEEIGLADISKEGSYYGLSDLEYAHLHKKLDDYMEKIESLTMNDPDFKEDNVIDIIKKYVKDSDIKNLKESIYPLKISKSELIKTISKTVLLLENKKIK